MRGDGGGEERAGVAGGNLPLMTRLIFFQRLEPVTTEHLVPHSSSHTHRHTQTHTHTQSHRHTHAQTPCPDLHVCLLVHTGSNDTGASHRSIPNCHSAGKHTHTHTHTHTHKNSWPDADTHMHTCEVGYAFAHLCMLEAMFSTTSADAHLLLPLLRPHHPLHTHAQTLDQSHILSPQPFSHPPAPSH